MLKDIAHIEETALRLAAPYSAMLKIIQSAPDSSDFSATVLLRPTIRGAGKKKSVRISRAGVYIKPLRANVAINDKNFPRYRKHYEALKLRRGHKRAIIAIARMLLTAIYHMLKNGEFFNPTLY